MDERQTCTGNIGFAWSAWDILLVSASWNCAFGEESVWSCFSFGRLASVVQFEVFVSSRMLFIASFRWWWCKTWSGWNNERRIWMSFGFGVPTCPTCCTPYSSPCEVASQTHSDSFDCSIQTPDGCISPGWFLCEYSRRKSCTTHLKCSACNICWQQDCWRSAWKSSKWGQEQS